MWAVAVNFLRGVCVATDTGQWDKAEWPPHPARLFMAMAATYFEMRQVNAPSAEDALKRRALEWLEEQPAPRLFASMAETRTPVTVFVPINDSTKSDQLLRGSRSRQPRYFPASIPHHEQIFYVWDGTIYDEEIAEGLKLIAFDVSRLGHSSSLVQVWIEPDFSVHIDRMLDHQIVPWLPVESGNDASTRFRNFTKGSLASLENSYNEAAIEEFVALEDSVKQAKGKDKTKWREMLVQKFPNGIPASLRPQPALTVGYRQDGDRGAKPKNSCFDRDLLVLAIDEAPTLGLESTLQLAGAIRKRIHDCYQDRTSPEWLGGHKPDGSPTNQPHAAIIPLPFVGYQHADGHILGMAIAFPKGVSPRERALALRNIFDQSEDGDEWIVRLQLKGFRRLTDARNPDLSITLIREQRLSPPRNLQSSTWTSSCRVWETVTPIVLDRFPKRDRLSALQAWNEEVAEIISSSCQNIGLPQPAAIHVHHNAFLSGVPRSRPERSGFPTMPARDGKPARFQIHARLEFDVPVEGPVILGAGRFVGYGLCRPNLQLSKKRRKSNE
jgi:CRISPR-associated protein Csb2